MLLDPVALSIDEIVHQVLIRLLVNHQLASLVLICVSSLLAGDVKILGSTRLLLLEYLCGGHWCLPLLAIVSSLHDLSCLGGLLNEVV